MEYVDGRTVYDDIVKHKRFSEARRSTSSIQIAEALEHAHEKGLIHRDVKPKNIMITKEGVAKLADMGLARAITDKEAAEAEAGKAFGTPYYISPEQIRGEKDIGPPADIYSLGATLYHMVTGTVPFDGKNPSAVMHKHLKAELVAPGPRQPQALGGHLRGHRDDDGQAPGPAVPQLRGPAAGPPMHFPLALAGRAD
jgi:serine/threonine protein kinase